VRRLRTVSKHHSSPLIWLGDLIWVEEEEEKEEEENVCVCVCMGGGRECAVGAGNCGGSARDGEVQVVGLRLACQPPHLLS